jgi:hypothetical protein
LSSALKGVRRIRRQLDLKAGSLSDLGAYGDSAAHSADQVFYDGQPKARAARGATSGWVSAKEALEDSREMLCGDPRAGVFNLYQDATHFMLFGAQGHGALVCVPDSVLDEVGYAGL